jgi:hypothetical protein
MACDTNLIQILLGLGLVPSSVVEPDPSLFVRIQTVHHQAKKCKKTHDFSCLCLLYDFLSSKTDVNVPSTSNKQKKLFN